MIKKFNEYIKESSESIDIFDAAREGDLDYIKRHINKSNIDSKNKYGYAVLMYATDYDNLDIVKYLVENGADVDIKDNYGCTALMYACIRHYIDMIKYLIECGADVNIKSYDDENAYGFYKRYFNSYEFQKWYMQTIGSYEKLNTFVEGNIHSDIKKEYANDAFKMDLGL